MPLWNCTIAAALALTVVACATPPPVETATASTAAGFDGTYSGEALADQITEGCGAASKPIEIRVKGSHIYTRHSHLSLDGTIDTSGEVSMQNGDGSSTLTGSIQGSVLTATETTSTAPKKLEGFYANAAATCMLAVHATKQSGDADSAP